MGKDLKGKNIGTGFGQRKDGRYEARAVINGVKIHLYDMNLSQLRKNFEEEKARVVRHEKNNKSNMLLVEWFNEWFPIYKEPKLKSEIACKTYRRKIANTYIRCLGDKTVESITQCNVQEATNELLEQGYNCRSIREALSVLSQCLEAAAFNGMIRVNPCKDIFIKKANISQEERRILEHWEEDLFLEISTQGFYYEVFCLMLLTGLRIGEISALHWEDVDFYKRCIYVRYSMQVAYIDGEKIQTIKSPKTVNGYRPVPFFGNANDLFKAWQKKQQEYKESAGKSWRANPEHGNLVFTTTLGSPLTRYNIVHEIARIERNMKIVEMTRAIDEHRIPREIKHIHPHAFRHTFATRCHEMKLDPLFIQRIMGHADYSTTIGYTHFLESTVEEEVNKTKLYTFDLFNNK